MFALKEANVWIPLRFCLLIRIYVFAYVYAFVLKGLLFVLSQPSTIKWNPTNLQCLQHPNIHFVVLYLRHFVLNLHWILKRILSARKDLFLLRFLMNINKMFSVGVAMFLYFFNKTLISTSLIGFQKLHFWQHSIRNLFWYSVRYKLQFTIKIISIRIELAIEENNTNFLLQYQHFWDP